jgi:hypothetical protein
MLKEFYLCFARQDWPYDDEDIYFRHAFLFTHVEGANMHILNYIYFTITLLHASARVIGIIIVKIRQVMNFPMWEIAMAYDSMIVLINVYDPNTIFPMQVLMVDWVVSLVTMRGLIL